MSQGNEHGRGDRPPAGGGGERARSARRRDFLGILPTLQRGRERDGRGEAARRNSAVFEDVRQAHREIHGLYAIAQTMGTSLGVSDTMTLIAAKLRRPRAVLVRRAVSARRGDPDAAMPVRDGDGCGHRPADFGALRRGTHGLGRAQSPRARECGARRRSRSGGPCGPAHDPAVRARVPAGLRRSAHRHALGVPHRPGVLPRRSPADPGSHLAAGGRGHQQLDPVRAEAGGLAHGSVDGASEHGLPVHVPDEGARAGGATEVPAWPARHPSRRSDRHQQDARALRRRSRALRSRAGVALGDPPLRRRRPVQGTRIHRRPVGVRARASWSRDGWR